MSKISLSILIATMAFVCFALPASAQSSDAIDVEVWDGSASSWQDFSSETLFNEGNIMPGDAFSREVRVSNNTLDTKKLAVELIDNTGCASDCLSDALFLTIFHNSAVKRQGSLSSFYPTGETEFDQLPGNTIREYELEITFMGEAGNQYQDSSADFDIQVGVLSDDESISEEVTSGGTGSSGSSFFYNDLRITRERVQNVQPTSATVTWDTNRKATSRVIYAPEGYDHTIDPDDPPKYGYAKTTTEFNTPAAGYGTTSHRVQLTDLFPDTIYYFRCVSHASPEEQGTELMFKTPKEGVAVLGQAGQPELEITKSADQEFANPGEAGIVYKIKVANNGAIPARGVKLSDRLPAGLVYSDTDKTAKAWDVGEIRTGQFEQVRYSVDVAGQAEPGTYTSVAEVSALNHRAATATSDLEIRSVDVAGFSNIPSGFEVREFYLLLFITIILVGSGRMVSKRASSIRC